MVLHHHFSRWKVCASLTAAGLLGTAALVRGGTAEAAAGAAGRARDELGKVQALAAALQQRAGAEAELAGFVGAPGPERSVR